MTGMNGTKPRARTNNLTPLLPLGNYWKCSRILLLFLNHKMDPNKSIRAGFNQ
jgi:hypothetical protein